MTGAPTGLKGGDPYLDLLKLVLTDSLHAEPPDVDDEPHRFLAGFIRHYVNGRALTLLPVARLDFLDACIRTVVRDGVPGDVIEAGVWRGGAAIFMRAVLRMLGAADRTVWLADSFQGLPAPDPTRFPLEARAHDGPVLKEAFQHFSVPLERVEANFRAFGLLGEQVRFLQGWFRDTLPTAPIDRLSVMHLDADYHQSTTDVLVSLYDRLSPGGYVIVDDYGETEWTCCRQAVDEFRAGKAIADPMVQIDRRCWYWRRTG